MRTEWHRLQSVVLLSQSQTEVCATIMKPTIYLALTHDWELRGDGSGDIEQIQFAPLRRLLQIYAKWSVRTTILPDVMQQLAFRRSENAHPELKSQVDSWDQHLLRPIDSSYRCLAFRAGALAAAPSTHLLKSLASLGIELEVSIAAGVLVNSDDLQLDYRSCEETFLPFYPVMEDARRVSDQREDIVCVPLNHFYGSRREVTRQNISLVRRQIARSSATHTRSAPTKVQSKSSSHSRI